MSLIGIDVGGTNTLAVRIDAHGDVLARLRTPTPQGPPEALLDMLASIIAELNSSDVIALGVCLPGMVDADTGVLVFAPRPPWRQVPIRELLMDRTELPVAVSNDANAATWAEYSIGAGVGHENLVGVMVGTGVGCGVIVRGALLQGAHGLAAEVGTMISGASEFGRFEDLASGSALTRMGRQAMQHGGLRQFLGEEASESSAVTGESLTTAARGGSETARAIIAGVGADLGSGIATLINIFDPSLVVVGGGAANAGTLLLEPARQSCALQIYGRDERPGVQIVQAKLGDEAGAIGSALLAPSSCY